MHSTAVLFDTDGVVVDSERHWVEVERDDILPAAVEGSVDTTETTGMNFREIYDYLAERNEMTVEKDEWVARYEAAARDIYGERVDLAPGLRDLLADLRADGRQVALVSSSPRDWIDRVLDRFALRGDFDAVVSAEEIDGASKPDPGVYEYAAAQLGVDPGDCIAVEDSENGVESAKAAGTRVVGYRNHSPEELDLSAADAVVASCEELRAVLLEESDV